MVGFALSHGYVLFFLPMILSFALAHVALALLLSVTFARWLRRFPTPKWKWLSVIALACFHGACVRTLRFLDDHDGQVCRAGESRDEFPDDGSRR
jgi:hypothetical protein